MRAPLLGFCRDDTNVACGHAISPANSSYVSQAVPFAMFNQ